MNQKLEISFETILKIGFAFLLFYLFYLIRDILVFIFFGSIISILFNPIIDFLEKRRIPRTLATFSIYLLIFLILGFLIYKLAPFFVSEFQQFSQVFSQYLPKFFPFLKFLGFEKIETLEEFNLALQEWLKKSSSNIIGAVSSIFGGIFSTFTLSLFFSLEKKEIEEKFLEFLPQKHRSYILSLFRNVQNKVSSWFGIRILACIFVGFLTLLTCFLLKTDYPFLFSFFASLLELIPVFGPILTAIILFLFTLLQSFWKATFLFIAFFLIQQIEGNILTPILAKKVIGLPSVFVLIAMMIGGKIFGFLGAILAIPLFGFLFEFFSDFLKKQYE